MTITNKSGYTPGMLAESKNHASVSEILLNNSISLSSKISIELSPSPILSNNKSIEVASA